MTASPDSFLKMTGINKSFPGVKALSEVNLQLSKGRLTAILGENGAGKTTLMRIAAGVIEQDAGEYWLEGELVSFNNPREALEKGIAMIYQELNLIQELTVAENIFLGREPLNNWGLIDYPRMNEAASVLLKRLDLYIPPDTVLETLRVGQQQIIEIAKAISHEAKVLIMDEPTSAITEHEIQVLFRIIKDLKTEGVAIAYITHKLEELSMIADDFIVMRDGKLAGAGELKDHDRAELIHMMVGRDVESLHKKTSVHTRTQRLFEVKNISLQHPTRSGDFLVNDISFHVREGEVLGVFGLMGAGRTELLETIYGLHPSRSTGEVLVGEKRVRIRNPEEAISHGIVLAPEDRKLEGLVLDHSIRENTSLPGLSGLSTLGLISKGRETGYVDEAIKRFRVKAPSIEEKVCNLSGGNQQKVILGKWLATNPKVVLLDEPTRGIDIGAKKEIYAFIDELASAGIAVVLVSSELPEIMAVSNRIVVLCEGRMTLELGMDAFNENTIMEAALPKE